MRSRTNDHQDGFSPRLEDRQIAHVVDEHAGRRDVPRGRSPRRGRRTPSPPPPGPARKSPARPIHLRRIRSSRLSPTSSSTSRSCWFGRRGTGRLFLGELRGRVYSFPNDPGCKKADLALELGKVYPDLTRILRPDFHPDFDKNRYVYVCYVRKNDVPDGSVVSRFTVSRTDPPVIDPAERTGHPQVLFRRPQRRMSRVRQ